MVPHTNAPIGYDCSSKGIKSDYQVSTEANGGGRTRFTLMLLVFAGVIGVFNDRDADRVS